MVAPTDVAPDSPQSYYRVADRLTEEIPGAFQPNQYANPANPETHYLTTGPELWRQSGGRITHLVVRRRHRRHDHRHRRATCKEQNPEIEIIGADPVGSIYSNEEVHPYLVEGVGEDFWPATYDPSRGRPLRDASPTATRSSPRAGWPRPRACWSAARAASPCTRRSRSRAGSTTPRRWSR